MMIKKMKVGFVGLGDMGGPMAGRIIGAGFPTTLWARRQVSLEPYLRPGVKVAENSKSLGAVCDVIGVCVFGDDDVREVVLGAGDGILYGMKPGGVIAVHSTISMETCRELEAIGKERGVTVLDAPVSGARARQSALDGELVVMVGGELKGFDMAKPVFESFGNTVCWLGPIGSGQKAKALNNVLASCNLRMGHLALKVAEQLGLNADVIGEILCKGSGRSAITTILINQMIPNPDFAEHAAAIMRKDISLFQDLCRESGADRNRLDELAEESIEVVSNLGQTLEN